MCILFVEDEFLIVMMAEEALQDAGHEVMTAPHASAAVRLIADHPGHFTVLVTDIHMPGELTGRDLVEHTRERHQTLPIVVATARSDVVPPAWRKRHRATLLPKPYTPKLLVDMVHNLVKVVPVMHAPFQGEAVIIEEGEAAREAGISRWQNPYVHGTQQHAAWIEGWTS